MEIANIDLDYVNYVLNGEYTLDKLTSKHIGKYNKVINLLSPYKLEFYLLNKSNKETILKYILSNLDKRIKFSTTYEEHRTFNLLLKLFRDIKFQGATSLEVKEIKREFNGHWDIEQKLEEMKRESYFEIESRGDLFQIRF